MPISPPNYFLAEYLRQALILNSYIFLNSESIDHWWKKGL